MGAHLAYLAPIIPVVAGAVIALSGGWIKYWIDSREERRTRQREKLEDLLRLVYGIRPWMDNLENRLAFGTTNHEIASPVEEIEVIGSLYFHELKDEVDAVAHAAKNYAGAMYSLAAERLKNGQISPHTSETIKANFPPVFEAIAAITARARIIAKGLS